MNKNKLILIVVVLALIGAFFVFDLWKFLSLEAIKEQQNEIVQFYENNRVLTIGLYFAIYVVVTALSLPVAAVITLLGGAIFGLVVGTIVVSFASTTGATLAFLGCRYLFRESVESKFSQQLSKINAGMERDGMFYLFTLRVIPIVPFFVVNLLMGLTKIPTRTFFWVSQLGMLAGTAVFVNAGTQLAKIESLDGIFSAPIIISFAILGLFPYFAKTVIGRIQAQRALKGFNKPSSFDRNLVVIGAGSAGLVSAYIAAAVKAKVTLIEKNKMGGDCLNTGCVPSKTLIRSAKLLKQISRSSRYGVKSASAEFDFKLAMQRVRDVITAIEPHDSVERYTSLGVDCVSGEARITSPWSVEVNGETLTTRNIIIASGARPFVPPIEGIEEVGYVTSDTLWELDELPKRFVVLGGGPIGSELAQVFARFGSDVTQIEMLPRLLVREDPEVSEVVTQQFIDDGITVMTDTRAERCLVENGEKQLICTRDGETITVPFDVLLVAVGRTPRTEGLGLEELGVKTTPQKTIETDDYLQTIMPTIYAVGDVAGPYQFTHVGAHQAWFGAVNSLFGTLKRFRADYSVIPFATFTDPEVARVGINETEAKAQNIEYEVTTYGIDDLDRAIADGEAHGFVKVLTVPGKDKILGATIVGEHSGELIAEFVLAMKHGLGLNKILGTIHIYPTMAEANKYLAGNWKRAHQPEKLLEWIERFHAWRRG
ncbi:MAG: FAD-dependent oxidoreductase [Pseudomonadota bacterium]